MNAQQETIQEKLEKVKKHEPYWHPHVLECDKFQRELEEQFFQEARFLEPFQQHGIVLSYSRSEKEYYPQRKERPSCDRSKSTTFLFFTLDKKGFYVEYHREIARNTREILTMTEFVLQLEKDVQQTMYTFHVGPRRVDLHYHQEIGITLKTILQQEEQFGETARIISTIDVQITKYLNEIKDKKKEVQKTEEA